MLQKFELLNPQEVLTSVWTTCLPKNVIVAAHAIGMGLYSEDGLIQIPSAPDVWASIGYESENGIVSGREVTLYRPKETSPDFLKADASTLVSVKKCESFEEQLSVLTESILPC